MREMDIWACKYDYNPQENGYIQMIDSNVDTGGLTGIHIKFNTDECRKQTL